MGPTFISNIFLSCWTKLDGMLDENFNWLQRPSNTHIQHLFIHSFIFKMATYKGAVVMVLTELVDQMMKNLVEGKQENGSKGGEKVASSKTFQGHLKGMALYRACFFFTTAHNARTVKLRIEWIRSPLVIFNKDIRIDVRTFKNIKINIGNGVGN